MNRKTSPQGHKLNREIGQRLARYRKEIGLSQQMLAEACRVSATAVSNWENGLNGMSSENLLVMHQAFGISLDWLIADEGRPHRAVLRSP